MHAHEFVRVSFKFFLLVQPAGGIGGDTKQAATPCTVCARACAVVRDTCLSQRADGPAGCCRAELYVQNAAG